MHTDVYYAITARGKPQRDNTRTATFVLSSYLKVTRNNTDASEADLLCMRPLCRCITVLLMFPPVILKPCLLQAGFSRWLDIWLCFKMFAYWTKKVLTDRQRRRSTARYEWTICWSLESFALLNILLVFLRQVLFTATILLLNDSHVNYLLHSAESFWFWCCSTSFPYYAKMSPSNIVPSFGDQRTKKHIKIWPFFRLYIAEWSVSTWQKISKLHTMVSSARQRKVCERTMKPLRCYYRRQPHKTWRHASIAPTIGVPKK